MSAPAAAIPVTPVPLWKLLGAVPSAWVAALVFGLGTSALLVGGGRELGLPASQSMIITLVPFLAALAVLFPAGWFLGRRWPNAVVITALVLGFLGVLVTAFAPTSMMIAAGRVGSGIGAGAIVGVATVLLSRVAPGRSVALLVSALVLVLAGVAGWFAGTALEAQLGFRPVVLLSCIALGGAGLLTVVAAVHGLVRRT